MVKNQFSCPRCKNKKLIEKGSKVYCEECELEFLKQDLEKYEKNQILSSKEKSEVFDAFKKFSDNENQ